MDAEFIRGAIFVALGLVLSGLVGYINMKDEEELMAECTQVHANYECKALWRTGVLVEDIER